METMYFGKDEMNRQMKSYTSLCLSFIASPMILSSLVVVCLNLRLRCGIQPSSPPL